MKQLIAGAALVACLAMAQVVAAGVLQVLAPLALEPQDEGAQFVAMVAVGVLAVGCALAFLKGCLRVLIDQLQCRPSRRGG